jgi:hypothetical protein
MVLMACLLASTAPVVREWFGGRPVGREGIFLLNTFKISLTLVGIKVPSFKHSCNVMCVLRVIGLILQQWPCFPVAKAVHTLGRRKIAIQHCKM